jgi:hypothetical protein
MALAIERRCSSIIPRPVLPFSSSPGFLSVFAKCASASGNGVPLSKVIQPLHIRPSSQTQPTHEQPYRFPYAKGSRAPWSLWHEKNSAELATFPRASVLCRLRSGLVSNKSHKLDSDNALRLQRLLLVTTGICREIRFDLEQGLVADVLSYPF